MSLGPCSLELVLELQLDTAHRPQILSDTPHLGPCKLCAYHNPNGPRVWSPLDGHAIKHHLHHAVAHVTYATRRSRPASTKEQDAGVMAHCAAHGARQRTAHRTAQGTARRTAPHGARRTTRRTGHPTRTRRAGAGGGFARRPEPMHRTPRSIVRAYAHVAPRRNDAHAAAAPRVRAAPRRFGAA